MAGVDGFEPSDAGVKVLCLTAWRYPNIKPKTGIEPVLSPQQLRNRTAWAITPLYHFSLLWHITRHRKSVELPIVRFAKMVGKMGLEPITHSMCNCCLCLCFSDIKILVLSSNTWDKRKFHTLHEGCAESDPTIPSQFSCIANHAGKIKI